MTLYEVDVTCYEIWILKALGLAKLIKTVELSGKTAPKIFMISS
jgi:hypothetical protein